MDDIIAFIFEFMLDTGFEIIQTDKIPRPVRMIILAAITLLYIAFITILIVIGINSKNGFVIALMSVVALVLSYMLIRLWYKVIANHPFRS